jgi:predicted peptidase
MRSLFSFLFALCCAAALGAAEPEARRFESTVSQPVALDYLVYLPEGYASGASDAAWPLILYLHGSGGYGGGLETVRRTGLAKFLEQGGKLPAVVIAPQATTWWDQTADALFALLDQVGRDLRVDPDRVYVVGQSAGGSGTWSLITQQPERFAAAIPICGAGSRAGIKRVVDLPIWVFHGGQDEAQPVEESVRMVDAIRAVGGERVKLTVYPDVGHDAWTPAFADVATWEWLFAQRRERR